MKSGITFAALILCTLAEVGSYYEGGGPDLPKLPEATLLLGYGPGKLYLMNPRGVVDLQPKGGEPTSWGHMILVTMSRDGETIASVKLRDSSKEIISTYSVPENTWVEYLETNEVWSVSISPDKSHIAFVGAVGNGSVRLRLLNLRTKTVETIIDSPVSTYGAPTWSPNGRSLAYQVDLPTANSFKDLRNFAIHIVDLETRDTRRIGTGQNPSWSPNGEWIAYLDSSGLASAGSRCMAVRPDGTNTKTLYALPRTFLGRQRLFAWAPVWSPDGKRILLNEVANWDEWKMNVVMLEPEGGKLKRLRSSGDAVLGWAESK